MRWVGVVGVFQGCGVFINPRCLVYLLVTFRVGDGSPAPSLRGFTLDGSPVPLGSTATHDPTGISKALWARWKSLDATNKHELMRMSI